MLLAHFSDIVRMLLLKEIGGVWVDSTCFCNKPLDGWLPEMMANGFFAFSWPAPDRMIASWFLAGNGHSIIVEELFRKIVEYWEGHARAHQYLFLQSLFKESYGENPEFRRVWDSVPKVNCDTREHEGPHLFVDYRKALFSRITPEIKKIIDDREIPLFKLSHYAVWGIEYLVSRPNSVIGYLLNDNMSERFSYMSHALRNFPAWLLKGGFRRYTI
jgi:hypothetical protein